MNKKPRATHQNYTKRQEVFHKVPGLKVTITEEGDRAFEKALRLFGKKVQGSGLLRELRDREAYEKPSVTRKRARAIGIKREERRREESSNVRKRKY